MVSGTGPTLPSPFFQTEGALSVSAEVQVVLDGPEEEDRVFSPWQNRPVFCSSVEKIILAR